MNANTPQISIIIPALNEAEYIKDLICHLRDSCSIEKVEIILADGGSTDGTVSTAVSFGARVVQSARASRPLQMNQAAAVARAPILCFLHADTRPPKDYFEIISAAVSSGSAFGCFRFRFDSHQRMLRFNAYCTRLPFMICRGGDQSLFISRTLFDRLEGFDESHVVMEDYDLIRRGRKLERFQILPHDIVVSARKYYNNSYTRVNLSNLAIFCLYYVGVKPETLKNLYARMLRHPKFKK